LLLAHKNVARAEKRKIDLFHLEQQGKGKEKRDIRGTGCCLQSKADSTASNGCNAEFGRRDFILF
jgi:hypothetical protein